MKSGRGTAGEVGGEQEGESDVSQGLWQARHRLGVRAHSGRSSAASSATLSSTRARLPGAWHNSKRSITVGGRIRPSRAFWLIPVPCWLLNFCGTLDKSHSPSPASLSLPDFKKRSQANASQGLVALVSRVSTHTREGALHAASPSRSCRSPGLSPCASLWRLCLLPGGLEASVLAASSPVQPHGGFVPAPALPRARHHARGSFLSNPSSQPPG